MSQSQEGDSEQSHPTHEQSDLPDEPKTPSGVQERGFKNKLRTLIPPLFNLRQSLRRAGEVI